MIPARCKSHPKEAAFRHKYAPSNTALHRILHVQQQADEELELGEGIRRNNYRITRKTFDFATVKLNAIQAILKAHPPAATIQDAFGRIPLHLACMGVSASPSGNAVLDLLIRGDGVSYGTSACWLQDVEKRTPLHYLLARSIDIIPMDALQVLLQACPEAAVGRDGVEETPVDIVTRRGQDGEIMIESVDQVLEILRQYTAEVVASGGDGLAPTVSKRDLEPRRHSH